MSFYLSIMKFSFFFFAVLVLLAGPFTGICQQAGSETTSKNWLQSISQNALGRQGERTKFSKAPPGFALYFSRCGTIDMPYLVYIPKSYDPNKASSMVVFLHGAILARDSFQYKDPAIANEPVFAVADASNTIVVFPFGRSGFMWPANVAANENILAIIEQATNYYNIDKQRIYLGGISMGGIATFWFITHHPTRFAGFYTFSAMPGLASGEIAFSNITNERPLYSMHARDDHGFPFNEVNDIYEQHKKEAPGWKLSTVVTGGHRFIYGLGGSTYIQTILSKLLKQ